MKRMIILTVAMLMASSALALFDDTPNTMGIYLDTTADEFCVPGLTEPLTEFTFYMILSNPEFSAFSGLEVGYHFNGIAEVNTADFGAGTTDAGAVGNHLITYDAPVLTGPLTIVATLTATNLDFEYGPAILIIEGGTVPALDFEYPVAILDDGSRVECHRSFADGSTIRLNAGCDIVSSESLSFDGIKSLYR